MEQLSLISTQNLLNKPEYNGKTARVVGPWTDPENGSEWLIVEVDGKEFVVKPSNVALEVSPVADKPSQARSFFSPSVLFIE